jgi:Zn-dependent M28 family amino/carboxypeptidase
VTKPWHCGAAAICGVLGCSDPTEATIGESGTSGAPATSSSTDPLPTTTSGSTSSGTGTGPLPTTGDPDSSSSGSSSTSSSTSGTSSGESSSSDGGTIACPDLRDGITATDLEAHLLALDDIATASGGNRAAGTEGYDLSLDYVRAQLEGFGYATTLHEFELYYYEILANPQLAWQGQQTYTFPDDFQAPQHTHAGEVIATAEVIDVALGPDNQSTSGCEAADFVGFTPGNIAILQRGECLVVEKVEQAQAAGAAGVVVFNQGDSPDREGTWWTSLGALEDVQVPVLLTTYAMGVDFAAAPDGSIVLEMDVDVIHELRPTASVIAETGTGDDVIMLGAHLDSVLDGPGINDNGSGVSALLEVARAIESCETTQRVRFAWWTAEEVGLVGSTAYVESLPDDELATISAYLNFDMVGSPNWARFHYDGDGSDFMPPGPPGSGVLEDAFVDFFDGIAMTTYPIGFGGRSDYVAFVDAGIAAGGLFTGAEGVKTKAQAEAHGGSAGAAYDGCYHDACDDADNVDLDALETSARAIAYALEVHALP